MSIIGTMLGSLAVAGGAAAIDKIQQRRQRKKEKKALKKQVKAQVAQQWADKKAGKIPSVPQGATDLPEGVNPAGSPDAGWQESPNKYNLDQQNVLRYLLSEGQNRLQNPYEAFEPIEQRAQNKFKSESLPSLAERFTALGGSDTGLSSDFAGMLSGAQSDFDLGLAGLKSQYGLQNQDRALDLLSLGLNPQTEFQYFDRAESPQSAGSKFFDRAGNAIGNYVSKGGDLGIGQGLQNIRARRAQRQEKQSITSNLVNKTSKLAGYKGGGNLSSGFPSASTRINAAANQIALKKLQSGGK